MARYLVVRHPLAKQRCNNAWHRGCNDLVEAITTTAEIGRLCNADRLRNQEVFFHRSGWGDPVICCAAEVDSVHALPASSDVFVRFKGARALCVPPIERRSQGDDCYEGLPPRE